MDTAVIRSEAQVVRQTAGTRATGDGPLPGIEDPRTVAPRDARELSRQFFQRLTELEEGTHEYQYARNTLIEMNMSLVRFAAGRFRGRGDDMEDIVQVGMIGLIKAIDRFELSREVEFTSFALPYIVGEIKRFFRDTTWAVHVPRRLQELRVELAKAREELRQPPGPRADRGGARHADEHHRERGASRRRSPPTATTPPRWTPPSPVTGPRAARRSSPTSSASRRTGCGSWRTSSPSPR